MDEYQTWNVDPTLLGHKIYSIGDIHLLRGYSHFVTPNPSNRHFTAGCCIYTKIAYRYYYAHGSIDPVYTHRVNVCLSIITYALNNILGLGYIIE